MTLEQVRGKLSGVKGKRYWRSIDELADTRSSGRRGEGVPRFGAGVGDPVSRRGFMKLMGASMALAGLAGCTKQPDEPIYPTSRRPKI